MQRHSQPFGTVGMPIANLLSRRHIEIAVAYLAGYVLLDWLSYVHPFADFGITPWNPPTGLSFALILLFGVEFVPWLFVAPVLADAFVRDFALPAGAQICAAAIVGSGYSLAAAILVQPRLRFDLTLPSRHSLLLLMVVAVASTALVAISYVGMLVGLDVLQATDFTRAALRFWVGDVIGIIVLTPFLLVLMTRRRSMQPTWEVFALLVLVAAALWIVFGYAEAFRFQLFYLFFLPVIWTAVRFGLEGVTAGLVVTQLGLVAAVHFAPQSQTEVTVYQALMVVLSVTGLAVGVLVSEQQRTQQQLRINQEALDRALRLSTMGEFAAALAHEINQPLTAVANYARVARDSSDLATATQASGRVIAQAERAADVIRRLRDLIRLGRSDMRRLSIGQLVAEATSYCQPELDRAGVRLLVQVPRDLPDVSVDDIQVEQAIINLVRNSMEALSDAGRYDGRIAIEVERSSLERIVVRVRDNGPGFDPGLSGRATAPFITTKPEGLGLGLSLTRSIIEAHGGELSIESSPSGAVVSFTLRTLQSNLVSA